MGVRGLVLAQAFHMVQPGISYGAPGHFLELALQNARKHDLSQVRLPLAHLYWIVYDLAPRLFHH